MRKANDITKWENVKGRIFLHLVNYKRHKTELADKAYVPFLDLAILFYCNIRQAGLDGFYVKKKHLSIWEQDIKSVFQAATENTFHEDNVLVKSVKDVLIQDLQVEPYHVPMIAGPEEPLLITLSNKALSFGGAMLLNIPVLKKLADALNSSLYLLPSSIHEILAVCPDPVRDLSYLTGMVKEVNQFAVTPEEYLSDNVYYFDREKCEIGMAVPIQAFIDDSTQREGAHDRIPHPIRRRLSMPDTIWIVLGDGRIISMHKADPWTATKRNLAGIIRAKTWKMP